MRNPGNQEDGRGRGEQRKQWPMHRVELSLGCRIFELVWALLFVASMIVVAVILTGCGGTPKQEVGIRAPVTVATDEGDVDVETSTVTEADAMAAGSVKADQARDIQTFGLDEGTRGLLSDALSGFWKQLANLTCVAVGGFVAALCVKLELPDRIRWPLMLVGLAMVAVPLVRWALLA